MDQYELERYGLPAIDRSWYWAVVKMGAAVTSKRRAIGRFKTEVLLLIELADQTDVNAASDQVAIPRLTGMEPYSCDWSLLMGLDHLCLFVSDMARLIEGLAGNVKLRGHFSDQQYEPDRDVGMDVVDKLLNVAEDFEMRISRLSGLRGNRYFRHSWLGLMNAHQWLCWTAAQTRIRRRHAIQIRNVAGVV
jgi:hypothetical protein